MSYEKVKHYFEEAQLGERLHIEDTISDTVEHAAETIGCKPAQIAKTMSFLTKEGPILVVSAGDRKINNRKFKDFFHQKATMIPRDQVEHLIGHEPGGVCPFAVNEGVAIYLDESLQQFDDIYAAAGNNHTTVHLTMDELIFHSHMKEWADLTVPCQ